MEPKLTKQSEAILAKLELRAAENHAKVQKQLLTEDELKKIRSALALVDSYGVFSRFIIGLSTTIAAIFAILNFWPGKGGGN